MTPAVRLTLVATVLCGMAGAFYATGPPPGYTGGFGEATCAECHFDSPLNDSDGTLLLKGIPDAYTPGKAYALELILVRPEVARGGFQLTTRFAEGPQSGGQAGRIEAHDGETRIDSLNGVLYLSHAHSGTIPAARDSIRWTMTWRAPEKDPVPVVFHVAANAANGDNSEFGDFVYALERRADVTP